MWWHNQHKPLVTVGKYIYSPILLLLFAGVFFAATTDIQLRALLRDPSAVADFSFYMGAISNIGIILWSATASICVFTATVLRRNSVKNEMVQFLLGSGVFTSILLVDDFFLIHEQFAPKYLGINGKVLFLSYSIIAVVLFFRYRRIIYRNEPALLLLSVAFLSGSVMVDVLSGIVFELVGPDMQFLIEDGSKLMGIAGWLGYFGWICYTNLVASCKS